MGSLAAKFLLPFVVVTPAVLVLGTAAGYTGPGEPRPTAK
jgi:hypothetical protein